ncbi:MAG: hypothetical protein IH873_00615 [Chloroflexi bacterium]|nr:hypothetical protein [Chloroflexota bacterium]
MISKRSFFWLILVLTSFLIAACSSTSSTLGQNHLGRILNLTVLEMDRTDELRYSTIDPSNVIRKWRIQPSAEGLELLLIRFKVENHIAVKTVFVADQQAVIVRGFVQNEYRPLSVNDIAFLDWRGQADATVTLVGSECLGDARLVVNAGTNVQWTNDGDTASVIQFGPGVLPELGADPVQIAPGGSVSHHFGQPGTYDYQCGGVDGPPEPKQVLVEDADSVRGKGEKNILFLDGPFELLRGFKIDGWMVFEVPIGTKIRDLRWRAGDSITIRF